MHQQFGVGRLAAEAIIIHADALCRQVSLSFKDLGDRMYIPLPPSYEGSWQYLSMLADKLDSTSSSHASVEKLAAKRIRLIICDMLKPVIETTKPLCETISKELLNQYDEGHISSSEYLNKFLDEVSKIP